MSVFFYLVNSNLPEKFATERVLLYADDTWSVIMAFDIPNKEQFSFLLRNAIERISEIEGQNLRIIRQQLASTIDRKVSAIEYWERTNNYTLPKHSELEGLADTIYSQLLDIDWLYKFLLQGKHPNPKLFSDYLVEKYERYFTFLHTDTLIGRQDYIVAIQENFKKQNGNVIITIDGLGGIGKTAVASKIYDLALRENWVEQVVWISAARANTPILLKDLTAFTFETILDEIGQQLGEQRIKELSLNQKTALIHNRLKKMPYLIILDNLETSDTPQHKIVAQLRPFLNPSRALLTSRRRFSGEDYHIHLSGLTLAQSIELMQQLGKEKTIPVILNAEESELIQIHESTGGSPLAIKLVVSLLQHQPLKIILAHLKDAMPLDRIPDEDEHLKFYRSIFQQTLKQLGANDEKVLIGLAQFAPSEGIPFSLIEALPQLSNSQIAQSIQYLWRLSLIEIQKKSSEKEIYYHLHPLTRSIVLSDLMIQETPQTSTFANRQAYFQQANDWFIAKMIQTASRYQKEPSQLLSYRQSILIALQQASEKGFDLLLIQGTFALALFWETFGHYEVALTFHEHCAQVATSENDQARTLFNQSYIHEKLGSYEKAMTLGKRGLTIARTTDDKKLMVDLLWQTGRMYIKVGALDKGDATIEEGLGLAESIQYYERMAWLLNVAGYLNDLFHANYAKAEAQYQQGLKLAASVNNLELLADLHLNLSVIHVRKAEYEQAKVEAEKALECAKQTGHREQICYILFVLAGIVANMNMDDLSKSISIVEEATQIAHELEHHELLTAAYMHKGAIATENQQYDEAEKVFEQAYYYAELLNNTIMIGSVLTEQGKLYLATEQWEKAGKFYEEALSFVKASGLTEYEGKVLYAQAQISQGLNDLEKAKRLGQESLALFQKIENEHQNEVGEWLAKLDQL